MPEKRPCSPHWTDKTESGGHSNSQLLKPSTVRSLRLVAAMLILLVGGSVFLRTVLDLVGRTVSVITLIEFATSFGLAALIICVVMVIGLLYAWAAVVVRIEYLEWRYPRSPLRRDPEEG